MKAIDVIKTIQEGISGIKENGHKSLDIIAMEKYLHNISLEVTTFEEKQKSNRKLSIEQWKLAHELRLAQYAAEAESNLENFRSVILAGQGALKSLMLINGGASVALLAFIGNLLSKDEHYTLANSIAISLIFFVVGVLCGGAAAAFTYLSQLLYVEGNNKVGRIAHLISVATGLGALILFGLGAFTTYDAFVDGFSSK